MYNLKFYREASWLVILNLMWRTWNILSWTNIDMVSLVEGQAPKIFPWMWTGAFIIHFRKKYVNQLEFLKEDFLWGSMIDISQIMTETDNNEVLIKLDNKILECYNECYPIRTKIKKSILERQNNYKIYQHDSFLLRSQAFS